MKTTDGLLPEVWRREKIQTFREELGFWRDVIWTLVDKGAESGLCPEEDRGGARGGGHARRRRSTRRGGVPVPVKTATATTSATGLEVAPALEGGTRAFGLAGRGDGTRAGPIWPCVVAAETGRGGEADELLRRAAPRQWRRWVLAQERSRGGDDWRGRMVGDSGHGHGFAWLRMASRRRIDTVVEG
uniref:Uncharacterized protein n=1 Tax=Oryza rufipogon TaxID=4529 RepID=A0A0E0NE48_ORYRU